jgi:hypothetical protein
MSEHTQHHRLDDHLDGTQTPVSVAEAAQLLNLSAEAVRSRVQRGTLASTKVDGKVYVLLDSDQARPSDHLSGEQTGDERHPNEHLSGDQTEFIASLQEQVDWLRREVERKDTLLMSLMQRIPELEPPSEPSGGSQAAAEEPSSTRAPAEQPKPSERRSWWREFFGLE